MRIAGVYDSKLAEREKAIAFYTLEVRDGGDSGRASRAQSRIESLRAKIGRERRASVPPSERAERPN